MIVAIIILFLFAIFGTVYITACVVHIRKIQKELEEISEEQSRQNADIRAIAMHTRDLTIAHNELVASINPETEKKNRYDIKSYYGPIGEA